MNIKLYSDRYINIWNDFVDNAKNKHFFFKREYMQYHSDRFKDYSLLFFDKQEKLIAILPANLTNNTLYTHQGLTFGGFIVDVKIKTDTMIELFNVLKYFLKKNNIDKIIYKSIPYIYHTIPAEEDRYALFINKAKIFRRDVSSTIYLDNQIKYSKGRKWIINKAIKNSIKISYSKDYESYWTLLETTLQNRHNSKPVHTLDEIIKLHNLFPNNIKLFIAKKENELLAGAVIFENEKIVHTQYLSNSDKGRKLGALDLLIDRLIKEFYKDKKYFDFGISNENNGKYLNKGLIHQKEGFGARAIVHDFYELDVK